MTGVIVAADTMSPSDLVDYVQRLEALGYESVWIPDMFGREIYVTAGHLLSHTDTLKVATGIAHVYGRDAIASAQAARTLSELSGGRFIHGLGISHPPAAELRGLTWEPPIEKMRTYLTELRAAMAGGLLHTPADPPPTPIYVAAHGPKMMQVAADLADGANTYMQPPEHTATVPGHARTRQGVERGAPLRAHHRCRRSSCGRSPSAPHLSHASGVPPAVGARSASTSRIGPGEPAIASSTHMWPGETPTRSGGESTSTSRPARRRCSSRSITTSAGQPDLHGSCSRRWRPGDGRMNESSAQPA